MSPDRALTVTGTVEHRTTLIGQSLGSTELGGALVLHGHHPGAAGRQPLDQHRVLGSRWSRKPTVSPSNTRSRASSARAFLSTGIRLLAQAIRPSATARSVTTYTTSPANSSHHVRSSAAPAHFIKQRDYARRGCA